MIGRLEYATGYSAYHEERSPSNVKVLYLERNISNVVVVSGRWKLEAALPAVC